MANLTYSTIKLVFPDAMGAAAARMLVNKWRQPIEGMDGHAPDWLGYVYVNAGVIEPADASHENWTHMDGYRVAGRVLETQREGRTLSVFTESEWGASVAAWGVIAKTRFPEADVLYYAEYEEGDLLTNDEACRGKWKVDVDSCDDDAARTTAIDILGGEDEGWCVSTETVIEVAEATGEPVSDVEDAVDDLRDIEIYAHPWDICDILEMD